MKLASLIKLITIILVFEQISNLSDNDYEILKGLKYAPIKSAFEGRPKKTYFTPQETYHHIISKAHLAKFFETTFETCKDILARDDMRIILNQYPISQPTQDNTRTSLQIFLNEWCWNKGNVVNGPPWNLRAHQAAEDLDNLDDEILNLLPINHKKLILDAYEKLLNVFNYKIATENLFKQYYDTKKTLEDLNTQIKGEVKKAEILSGNDEKQIEELYVTLEKAHTSKKKFKRFTAEDYKKFVTNYEKDKIPYQIKHDEAKKGLSDEQKRFAPCESAVEFLDKWNEITQYRAVAAWKLDNSQKNIINTLVAAKKKLLKKK